MPAFLQPDWQQVLSQAISFLILLALLKRFAWKPLLAMLDQRRARIEQDLREAARRKDELDRLQQEYSRRLSQIEEEARTKIQQAVLDGKRISMEIQEQARTQGLALVEKSKQTIELELAKAKVTLRNDLAAMTLDAVERILHKKLDAEQDKRLIDSVLDQLERKAARP